MRNNMRGVTLLELMIVVVIIGILAAIAFPNYRQFIARAKRSEAKAALLQVAVNQEKFYLQNSTFTTNMMLLGFATNPYVTDTGTYSVSVTVADVSNFTAVATYLFADEEAAKCATWQVDGRGVKSSGPLLDCWTSTR